MIYELGKICSRLSSGKSINAREITSKGIFPVFGGNGIRGYTNRKNFDGECAIIGRQGAYCGNVRYFRGEAYMTEHAVVVCANENNNTRYLAYLLSTMNLGRLSSQSAQPGLSVRTLSQQKVSIPPLEVQKKISAILSPLDDKIELNRRINANLEEQARAIFSFMFPDISFGNRTIGEYITPRRGKSLLSKNAVPGNVPVIAGGTKPAAFHNVANTKPPVVTIAASGTAGYVSLWHVPVWSSDSSFIDAEMTEHVYFWYLLLSSRQEEIYRARVGSVQPHIYPQHIAEMPAGNIDTEKIREFTEKVTPLFMMIGHNKEENNTLAKIRDSLIPKLISGEADLKNFPSC